MKALCKRCGKLWNISIYTKIGKKGYTCPHCTYIERKNKKVALFTAGFVISCLLVHPCSQAAYMQRGYKASGSEYLVPLLYLVVWAVYKEVLHIKKALSEECKQKTSKVIL